MDHVEQKNLGLKVMVAILTAGLILVGFLSFRHSTPVVVPETPRGSAGDYKANFWSTSKVTVATSTGVLVAAASNRQSLILQNNGAIGVWLNSTTSTVNNGYFLAPSSTLTFNIQQPYLGNIMAISASTTVTTSIGVNILY